MLRNNYFTVFVQKIDFIEDKTLDALSIIGSCLTCRQHSFLGQKDLEHALAKAEILILFRMHKSADNSHFALLIKLSQSILLRCSICIIASSPVHNEASA